MSRLGPAPCSACGRLLLWRDGGWAELDGAAHECPRVKCMDDAEWRAWTAANGLLKGRAQAASPCVDCTAGFALLMGAIDRCNGVPGQGRAYRVPPHEALERRRAQWRAYQRRRRERMAVA